MGRLRDDVDFVASGSNGSGSTLPLLYLSLQSTPKRSDRHTTTVSGLAHPGQPDVEILQRRCADSVAVHGSCRLEDGYVGTEGFHSEA